jgi:hypothetical protein
MHSLIVVLLGDFVRKVTNCASSHKVALRSIGGHMSHSAHIVLSGGILDGPVRDIIVILRAVHTHIKRP